MEFLLATPFGVGSSKKLTNFQGGQCGADFRAGILYAVVEKNVCCFGSVAKNTLADRRNILADYKSLDYTVKPIPINNAP